MAVPGVWFPHEETEPVHGLLDPEVREPVQSLHVEIIRRALPLIIPAIPIRSRETLKSKLFQLEPRGSVATQRQNASSAKRNRIRFKNHKLDTRGSWLKIFLDDKK